MAATFLEFRLRADPGLSLWVTVFNPDASIAYGHALPAAFSSSREYYWSASPDLADGVNPALPYRAEIRTGTDQTTFNASTTTYGKRSFWVKGGVQLPHPFLDAAVSAAGGGSTKNITITDRTVIVND